MSPSALIMAGGRSERMRATAGPLHKALVRVLGVPLLERNLCALLSEGFERIAVSVNSQECEVSAFLEDRGRALAQAAGARLEVIRETLPLGTIGAARQAIGDSDCLVVVNVDNLTALGLDALASFHRRRGAALTIATHLHAFRIPFGELELHGEFVAGYVEKPTKKVQLSSGTYILDRRACMAIASYAKTDVPELVSALLAKGEAITAFRHDAPWIDINDAAAVRAAERLVLEHSAAFERWRRAPDSEAAGLVLRSPAGVLIERRVEAGGRCERWKIPDRPMTRSAPETGLDQERHTLQSPRLLGCFDDLDTEARRLIRYHVFTAEVSEPSDAAHPGMETRWVHPNECGDIVSQSPVLARSLALLANHS